MVNEMNQSSLEKWLMSAARNGKSQDGPGASGGARQLGNTQKKDGEEGMSKGQGANPKMLPMGKARTIWATILLDYNP